MYNRLNILNSISKYFGSTLSRQHGHTQSCIYVIDIIFPHRNNPSHPTSNACQFTSPTHPHTPPPNPLPPKHLYHFLCPSSTSSSRSACCVLTVPLQHPLVARDVGTCVWPSGVLSISNLLVLHVPGRQAWAAQQCRISRQQYGSKQEAVDVLATLSLCDGVHCFFKQTTTKKKLQRNKDYDYHYDFFLFVLALFPASQSTRSFFFFII